MIEREYEYRLKSERTQLKAALFGAAALGFAYMASSNDRGLILFIIPLSRNAATIAYWAFAGLAAIMCVSDVVNVVRRGSLRQRIAFSPEGLLVPRSVWSTDEMLIPYDTVLKLHEFNEPKSVVVVQHRQGEFTLELDMLPDERAYAEIFHNLASRVQAAKTGSGRPADATGTNSSAPSNTPAEA